MDFLGNAGYAAGLERPKRSFRRTAFITGFGEMRAIPKNGIMCG